MSQCVHFIFCRERELKLTNKSVIPVIEKERKGKGKWSIGPSMKNGRTKPEFVLRSNKGSGLHTTQFAWGLSKKSMNILLGH